MTRYDLPMEKSLVVATLEYLPDATAVSTAKAAAAGSNGTGGGASMIGLTPYETLDTSSRGFETRRISTGSLRVELPARRVPGRAAGLAPPHGQGEEEPRRAGQRGR